MAVLDNANGDNEVIRILNVLNELADQLSQNRSMSISLQTLAGGVKLQSAHAQNGFVLRRFNQHIPKDVYDSELERMNATMSSENFGLMNDNKQLNTLIKEYEQTLENLMATFRTRANEVQQRELAIIREYENKLLIRETEELVRSLATSSTMSTSLARIGTLLRSLTRALGGEEEDSTPFLEYEAQTADSASMGGTSSSLSVGLPSVINSLELTSETIDDEKGRQLAAAEWALERECELARLERENEHLKQLLAGHLGISSAGGTRPTAPLKELPKVKDVPKVAARVLHAQLGGKDTGPYGIAKKFDETMIG